VVVAELNPVVLRWCRGPLAALTDRAVDDPRVTVEIADVADFVRRRSRTGDEGKFDAVIYDLYKGPHHHTDKLNDPLYGSRAISQVRDILNPGGVFAVWGENYDEGFVRRLRSAGFTVTSERPGRGGYRHAVFVAEMSASGRRPARSGKGRRK
jgi:spermidine synthase